MLLANGTDLVEALAWPVVVLIISLSLIVALFTAGKQATYRYVDRISKVTYPGGEIDTRANAKADLVQQGLRSAIEEPGQASLSRLTVESIDLGWYLAKAGMTPNDCHLTWSENQPCIVIHEPHQHMRGSHADPRSIQP